MSLHLVILVGIGGGIGSILRYFISFTLMPFSPWFTVIINISGGFLIGLLYQYTLDLSYSDNIRAFGIIGVCGGFYYLFCFWFGFFTSISRRADCFRSFICHFKCHWYYSCRLCWDTTLSVLKLG